MPVETTKTYPPTWKIWKMNGSTMSRPYVVWMAKRLIRSYPFFLVEKSNVWYPKRIRLITSSWPRRGMVANGWFPNVPPPEVVRFAKVKRRSVPPPVKWRRHGLPCPPPLRRDTTKTRPQSTVSKPRHPMVNPSRFIPVVKSVYTKCRPKWTSTNPKNKRSRWIENWMFVRCTPNWLPMHVKSSPPVNLSRMPFDFDNSKSRRQSTPGSMWTNKPCPERHWPTMKYANSSHCDWSYPPSMIWPRWWESFKSIKRMHYVIPIWKKPRSYRVKLTNWKVNWS